MLKVVPLMDVPVADLVTLWNLALGDDYPMREALFRRSVPGDLNFLPGASFAALDDGRPVGFVVAKANREFVGVPVKRLGHINSLVVHPDYRRRRIGSGLLRKAVEVLREHRPAAIHLGRDTFHFFPGVPEELAGARAFFAAMGAEFAEVQTDLIGDLGAYELPESVKQTLQREPVEIRPCRPEEVPLLAEHLRLSFPGRWQYEFSKYLYDGGDPADYIVVVEQGKVIGFCRIGTPESVWIGPSSYWAPLFPGGRFGGAGPLGVAREARGRGLGLAVTACAVAELKRRGITRACIDWTTLVDFYGLLGFKPWKRYISTTLPLS